MEIELLAARQLIACLNRACRSLLTALLCALPVQAYDEVQMAHVDGMMKTMELVCSTVGISVVEPTMSGPVVKPAPAKM